MSKRFLLAIGALGVVTAGANATVWAFNGVMDGLQEVPPNASPGTGSFTGTIDDVTGAFTLTGTYTGLLAGVTASHIHGPAPVGANGPVIVALTHTGGTSGTLTGGGTISLAQVADMMAGLHYVNVHTQAFPGGEIRGQIGVVPEPGTIVALGLGAILLVRRRRKA